MHYVYLGNPYTAAAGLFSRVGADFSLLVGRAPRHISLARPGQSLVLVV